jgi:hypothetical protein
MLFPYWVDRTCHNLFLGYSLNSFFFKRKKSKNKIKASNVEKASRGGFQTYRKIKLQFWMEFEA